MITQENTRLMQNPIKDSPRSARLYQHKRYAYDRKIQDQNGATWYHVILTSGDAGWVQSDAIVDLNEMPDMTTDENLLNNNPPSASANNTTSANDTTSANNTTSANDAPPAPPLYIKLDWGKILDIENLQKQKKSSFVVNGSYSTCNFNETHDGVWDIRFTIYYLGIKESKVIKYINITLQAFDRVDEPIGETRETRFTGPLEPQDYSIYDHTCFWEGREYSTLGSIKVVKLIITYMDKSVDEITDENTIKAICFPSENIKLTLPKIKEPIKLAPPTEPPVYINVTYENDEADRGNFIYINNKGSNDARNSIIEIIPIFNGRDGSIINLMLKPNSKTSYDGYIQLYHERHKLDTILIKYEDNTYIDIPKRMIEDILSEENFKKADKRLKEILHEEKEKDHSSSPQSNDNDLDVDIASNNVSLSDSVLPQLKILPIRLELKWGHPEGVYNQILDKHIDVLIPNTPSEFGRIDIHVTYFHLGTPAKTIKYIHTTFQAIDRVNEPAGEIKTSIFTGPLEANKDQATINERFFFGNEYIAVANLKIIEITIVYMDNTEFKITNEKMLKAITDMRFYNEWNAELNSEIQKRQSDIQECANNFIQNAHDNSAARLLNVLKNYCHNDTVMAENSLTKESVASYCQMALLKMAYDTDINISQSHRQDAKSFLARIAPEQNSQESYITLRTDSLKRQIEDIYQSFSDITYEYHLKIWLPIISLLILLIVFSVLFVIYHEYYNYEFSAFLLYWVPAVCPFFYAVGGYSSFASCINDTDFKEKCRSYKKDVIELNQKYATALRSPRNYNLPHFRKLEKLIYGNSPCAPLTIVEKKRLDEYIERQIGPYPCLAFEPNTNNDYNIIPSIIFTLIAIALIIFTLVNSSLPTVWTIISLVIYVLSFLGYFAYLKYIPKHIKRISAPDYIDAYQLYIRRFVNEFRAQQAREQSDASAENPTECATPNAPNIDVLPTAADNAQVEITPDDKDKSPKTDGSSPEPISF